MTSELADRVALASLRATAETCDALQIQDGVDRRVGSGERHSALDRSPATA